MLEDIYCNVLYTGKMGTALIPKVIHFIIRKCVELSCIFCFLILRGLILWHTNTAGLPWTRDNELHLGVVLY